MRRPVAAVLRWLSLMALLAALLPSAVAAAPIRIRDVATSLDCFVSDDSGFLFATVNTSRAFGSFFDVAFWAAPADPEADPPTYIATGDGTASSTGTSLTATIELVEFDITSDPPFGDPLPSAVLTATLRPSGDAIPYEDRFRDGNRFGRETGTIQPQQAEGTLTLPGDDLTDLSGCFAQTVTSTFFGSNPAARVASFADFSLGCSWETEAGGLEVHIGGTPGGFASIDVFGIDDGREFGGSDDAVLSRSAFDGAATLVDFADGSDIGSASATGTLTQEGDTIRQVDRNGRDWAKAVITLFAVDGTFDYVLDGQATSLAMDSEHCGAIDERIHEHFVRPNGPKARPYVNETPATATRLTVGGKAVKLTTGAGAAAAEAPCVLEDQFDVPLAHTAWWSVVGNGRDITVDTRGSDFDTVVGIYVRQGADLVQVACVDDNADGSISDLQARVTWASTAGVTYLIQAGGFATGSGHLVLAVR